MNSAQSEAEAVPSPTPIRSAAAPVNPLELVRVPTLVHSPLFQALVPVLLRAVPMHPDTMDNRVRAVYDEVRVYCA